MRSRLAPFIVTAVLLLGACGDDSSSPSDTGSGGETTTTVDAAADQAAADAAIAALEEDLAEMGFSAEPEDGDDDDAGDFEFESEACRRFEDAFPDEIAGETAEAEMDSYQRETDMAFESVEASIGMTESADDLDEVMALIGDEGIGECLGEAIRLASEEDQVDSEAPPFEMRDLTVTTDAVDGLGDENVRFRIGLTMAGAGLEVPTAFEMLMVRDDRVMVMTMVGSGGMGGLPTASLDAEAAAQILLESLRA